MRRRLFRIFGLEPVAHRPPLVWRFWVYAAAAYLMPVVVQIVFPDDPSSTDELVWLVTLVPAFILSLHYGLRGAFAALLMGTALFVAVQLSLATFYTADDPRVTVPIYIAYGTLAISVGWLSEQLHDHYELALELEAKQKTDSLGRLAAGLGHEFNNILTSMLANAELISQELPANAARGRAELDHLKTAAERGAGIVRNLLGLSRRGLLTLRPVHLGALVQELLPRIQHLLPDSVEVEFQCTDSLPPVTGDREAVREILVNLVTNARDAMPLGGTLRIAVTPGRLSREQFERRGWGDPGEYVRLSVSDSGSGMAHDAVNRVFDPFYTTKEPGEGIGLGMTIVYGLIKQHRGFVDVESDPGSGTIVHVYFPVSKDPAAVSAHRVHERPPGGSETILLVEDEESIRKATRRILERFGYTVIAAADGEEALQVHAEVRREVDLVLCDVLLPKLTGPEVHRAIRDDPSAPPFLFVSGYPAGTLQSGVSLDPALPFLPKPWTVDGLLGAIRSVLDRARAE